MKVYSDRIVSSEQLHQAHEVIERMLRESLELNEANKHQTTVNGRLLKVLIALGVINLVVSAITFLSTSQLL